MENKCSKIGETRMMNCGLEATIIKYVNSRSLDVIFPDGAIINNRTYDAFKNGSISHPTVSYSTTRNSRIGETRMMNCGMKATIIKYLNNKDIDVQFEDGTIFYHRRYESFLLGTISRKTYIEKREDKIGEKKKMNNGQFAEIVKIEDCNHVYIQFEDGTTVGPVTYISFSNGRTPNPNFNKHRDERLGMKKIMSNGQLAEIVEYNSTSDLSILFEDGTRVKPYSYDSFIKGKVLNPNFDTLKYLKDKYVNQKVVLENGETVTVVSIESPTKMMIEYSNGFKNIIKIKDFENGNITLKSPEYIKMIRTNKTSTMLNGVKATIIDYISVNNITVKLETGEELKNKRYKDFEKGTIFSKEYGSLKEIEMRKLRIGEKNINNQGLTMTISNYKNARYIDVIFDDGVELKNKTYDSFKSGQIMHPDYPSVISTSYNEIVLYYYFQNLGFKKSKHRDQDGLIGYELDLYNPDLNGFKVAIEYDGSVYHTVKKDVKKNKLCAKNNIILYRVREPKCEVIPNSSSNDFYLSTPKQYSEDLLNIIKEILSDINKRCNVNYEIEFKSEDKEHISDMYKHCFVGKKGEHGVNNKGQEMIVHEYRGCTDIDVLFPKTGGIATHKTLKNFHKGKIKDPNELNEFLGKKFKNRFGEEYEVINIRKKDDIDVRFTETGEIVKNRAYFYAAKGAILRPNTFANRLGEKSINKEGFTAEIIEYIDSCNIWIQFEDGTKKHITYQNFKSGQFKKDGYIPPKHIGEKMESKTYKGETMEVVAWNNNKDITVLFSDGTIRNGVSYGNFKLGRVSKTPRLATI